MNLSIVKSNRLDMTSKTLEFGVIIVILIMCNYIVLI